MPEDTTQSVRHQMPFLETMEKYIGIVDNAVYAAEILCPIKDRENVVVIGAIEDLKQCTGCPWQYFFDDIPGIEKDPNMFECKLLFIRRWLGERVPQHDIPDVPVKLITPDTD